MNRDMKNKLIIITLALASWCFAACDDSEELNPRTEPENVYGDPTLPQGNHDYDADIATLYTKYNTLFLYKYEKHDIYWNVTNNTFIPAVYDTTGTLAVSTAYIDVPAKEAHVGQLLALVKTKFLDHYPDAFLAQGLPKKVILVDSFVSVTRAGVITNAAPAAGYDCLVFPHAGAAITSLTAAQRNDFKSKASEVFLRKLVTGGKIERDPAFLAISDYTTPGSGNAAKLANGLINPSGTTREADWDAYVTMIVSTPYDTLVATRATFNPNLNADIANRRGFLTATVDTGGRILAKYNALIAYFEDKYGIDLQAIGNNHE
jgi:hypothetical protein